MKYLRELFLVWSGMLGSLGFSHVILWDSWMTPGLERSLLLGIPFLAVSLVLFLVADQIGREE